MAEQSLPNEAPASGTPPVKSWFLRVTLWAIIGAALGALWAFFHYGTEGWSGPILVAAIAFGLAGAIGSLVFAKACRT